MTREKISIGDIVFIHLYGANGKEIKTSDYRHPHSVCEVDGKLGVYYGKGERREFTPFDNFATDVVFEKYE